jgi:endonuclease III
MDVENRRLQPIASNGKDAQPRVPTKLKHSGTIWRKPPRVRDRIVRNVCATLKRTYGTPRLGNPTDPIDDLVYIILSNKTGPQVARKTYQRLRMRLPTWEQIVTAPISTVQDLLKPAGLSFVKSRQLRRALRSIKHRFGRCDLRALRDKPEEEIEEFLTSLAGVSEKVAKCIMMYTLSCEVLPVDVHVHRIASRLGWTSRKRADQCHEELELLVPARKRYAFHVDCVLHGRRICRPHEPLCRSCCIKGACEFYKKNRRDV